MITKSQINAIEQQWRDYIKEHGLKGRHLLDAQVLYFNGAVTALLASGIIETVPPRWFVQIIRDDNIANLPPMEEGVPA